MEIIFCVLNSNKYILRVHATMMTASNLGGCNSIAPTEIIWIDIILIYGMIYMQLMGLLEVFTGVCFCLSSAEQDLLTLLCMCLV
jgi:hypothetical protein